MEEKKSFVDMAHRVDMPEDFKTLFVKRAAEVGNSKNRRERISDLSFVIHDLNIYQKTLEINRGFKSKRFFKKE